MRIRFSVEAGGPSTQGWRGLFAPVATTYGMEWSVRDAATPYRAVVMVSRFGHCLNDLLSRWRSGALNLDIPAVVSNHRDLEPLVASYGIPFDHLPVTRDQAGGRGGTAVTRGRTRRRPRGARALHADAERRPDRDLSAGSSTSTTRCCPRSRARTPTSRRREEGVRVGSTAHYVTRPRRRADHPAGRRPRRPPDDVEDLVRAGEEVESRVLARAVRWHCESRVLLNGDRTVVFS